MSLTAKYTASVTLTGLVSGALVIGSVTPALQVQLASFYQGLQGPPGPQGEPAPIAWGTYIFWPSVAAGTVAGGAVRAHVHGDETVYRFIPDPYDPVLDGFYSAFTGGVLSDPIASRG